MKAIILPQDAFDAIVKDLETIKRKLDTTPTQSQESFLDNTQFLQRMQISKRTAQSWRDEGLISFSQVGNKIYYKLSDIEAFLAKHHNKAFKRI